MFFRVLHKILYNEIGKIRFIWYRDNGEIDRISWSRATRLIQTLQSYTLEASEKCSLLEVSVVTFRKFEDLNNRI